MAASARDNIWESSNPLPPSFPPPYGLDGTLGIFLRDLSLKGRQTRRMAMHAPGNVVDSCCRCKTGATFSQMIVSYPMRASISRFRQKGKEKGKGKAWIFGF